eukprot:scaffold2431_cov499-Pavlova_lutheri.AAC.1
MQRRCMRPTTHPVDPIFLVDVINARNFRSNGGSRVRAARLSRPQQKVREKDAVRNQRRQWRQQPRLRGNRVGFATAEWNATEGMVCRRSDTFRKVADAQACAAVRRTVPFGGWFATVSELRS